MTCEKRKGGEDAASIEDCVNTARERIEDNISRLSRLILSQIQAEVTGRQIQDEKTRKQETKNLEEKRLY